MGTYLKQETFILNKYASSSVKQFLTRYHVRLNSAWLIASDHNLPLISYTSKLNVQQHLWLWIMIV